MNFKVSEQNRSLETLIDPSLYLTLNWYLDIREWFLFVVKFFKWEQTFFLFLLFLFLLFFRLFHGDVRFRGITVFFTFFATARFLEQNPAVWGSFVIFIWKIRLHFLLWNLNRNYTGRYASLYNLFRYTIVICLCANCERHLGLTVLQELF